jgi:hypothetical protein
MSIIPQYMGEGWPSINHRVMEFEVQGNQMIVKYLQMGHATHNTFDSAIEKLAKIYPNVKTAPLPLCKTFLEWDGIKAGTNWCGFTPDEVGLGDWLCDKGIPFMNVDQFLEESTKYRLDLKKSQFVGKPPLQFTFKCAVGVVINHLEILQKESKEKSVFVCRGEGMYNHLLTMLTNIDNLHIDNMPNPPKYPHPICSASHSDHKFWFGAILQLLYENGAIKEYGRKGADYWVTLI